MMNEELIMNGLRIILYKYGAYYISTCSKITKVLELFSVLQIIYQPHDPFNDVIDCHHFMSSIPGRNFNFIPCVELEIPGGGGVVELYSPPNQSHRNTWLGNTFIILVIRQIC